MKRTINEKKAWKNILISFLTIYFSFIIYAASIRNPNIILGSLSIMGFFIGIMFFGYNFYSLGWEYKKIQMEEK